MTRRHHFLLYVLLVLALELPALSCGPDFPDAVFFLTNHPDGDYTTYVRGHLAVLQPGFHTRDLAVAYRYLSGSPLDATTQQQAVAANKHFVEPELGSQWAYADPTKPPPDTPLGNWIKARIAFGPVDNYTPTISLQTERTPTGSQYYFQFPNCLDPAFLNATATLADRIQQHGPHSPELTEWVRGQDAVFSNCGDGKPPQYFGPGKAPTPPPAPHAPANLADAPAWLQQDRAYQLAAAAFYATDYDTALTRFRAIAADTSLPWSITARYLVARTLIRKATIGATSAPNNTAESNAKLVAGLTLARSELLAMRTEPRMTSLLPSIDGLIDFVNLRIEPEVQYVTLAHRALTTASPDYEQTLIDLTDLNTQSSEDIEEDTLILPPESPQRLADRPSARAANPQAADLLDWIDALNGKHADAALAHWKSTHSTLWLVAALMFAQPADAQTPSLVAAAAKIPATDPAYLTITYHRLRLTPHEPSTRTQLLTLIPELKKSEGPSAINLFSILTSASAPTLEDWLQTAARTPAGETDEDSNDDDPATVPKENVCGTKVASLQLFDLDAAVAFNQQMPLRLLAAAAESQTLPANLRFQVAQAAWARAILLDQPAIARRMTPLLIACRPAWQSVLSAYNAAADSTSRHAEGLLALMRFASTEPSVREGEERRSGFAAYDEFRQNWWCTTVPRPTETVDSEPLLWFPGRDPDAPYGSDPATMTRHLHTAPPPPPFLTPADLAEAAAQADALRKIPNAGTYFANEALTWTTTHPNDPRTPDILGEAFRVLRNSCRNDDAKSPDNTAPLAHKLFDTLHQHYPTSPWTQRYVSWQ